MNRRGLTFACVAGMAVVAVLVPMVVMAQGAVSRTQSGVSMASLEAGVVTQINDIRIEHGLQPLQRNELLIKAATAHCDQMVADGYFSHETAAGLPFSERIEYYYPTGQHGYYSVGENLLWSTATTIDGSGVIDAWMRSPDHRANILSPAWRQIGVAAVSVPTAPGAYGGAGVTVVTTDFGVRN